MILQPDNLVTAELVKVRQQFCLLHPCHNEADLRRTGYRVDREAGLYTLGTTLSIDLFQQPVAWRASVAILLPDGAKLIGEWDGTDKRLALAAAADMLLGVGLAGQEIVIPGGCSIEVARLLTPDEHALIRKTEEPEARMPVGRFGSLCEYDLTNRKSQVSANGYQPIRRRQITTNDLIILNEGSN